MIPQVKNSKDMPLCLDKTRLDNTRLDNTRLDNTRLDDDRLEDELLVNERLDHSHLENVCFFSFDDLGNLLNSTNFITFNDKSASGFNSKDYIWIASADLNINKGNSDSYYTTPYTCDSQSHSTIENATIDLLSHADQKMKVRQLMWRLIDHFNLQAHPSYQGLIKFEKFEKLENFDSKYSYVKFDSSLITLDDSTHPYLLKPLNYTVSFSHSQHKIACAVRKTCAVRKNCLKEYPEVSFCTSNLRLGIGIDTELKAVSDTVAKRFFTKNEYHWLETVAPYNRQQARNLLWMVKEAFIKKHGNSNAQVNLFTGLKTDVLHPAKTLFDMYLIYNKTVTKAVGIENNGGSTTCTDITQNTGYFKTSIHSGICIYLPSIPLVFIF